jgi:hypothetical protein
MSTFEMDEHLQATPSALAKRSYLRRCRRQFISEDNKIQTSDSAQDANLSREGKARWRRRAALPETPLHLRAKNF